MSPPNLPPASSTGPINTQQSPNRSWIRAGLIYRLPYWLFLLLQNQGWKSSDARLQRSMRSCECAAPQQAAAGE